LNGFAKLKAMQEEVFWRFIQKIDWKQKEDNDKIVL